MVISWEVVKGKRSPIIITVLILLSALIVISAFNNARTAGNATIPPEPDEPQLASVADNWTGDYNITLRPVEISGPIADRTFNESAGIFTKTWDARNFEGFWRDEETGASTEELIIDQNTLNNSRRTIEKHNLIYRTRPIPVNYQVYRHTSKAPAGTEGSYQAIGWMGEKYVFFFGNKLAKVIFEQNETEVKIMQTDDSWNLADGYRLFARLIEAPLERSAWMLFSKGNEGLDETIFPDGYVYSYKADLNDSTPLFITYLSSIYRSSPSEKGEFKDTWLRARNLTGIKAGDIFGIMEITSFKNGTIELRNKEPIDLAPGSIINLMGDINFNVENSSSKLSFYPVRTQKEGRGASRTFPSLLDTISAEHPVLRTDGNLREIEKDYYFRDYRQEGSKFNISAYPKRGGREESIVITLQNDFTGKERLKSIEIISGKGKAVDFRIVAVGNWSGYNNPAFLIINSKAEWNDIWQKHSDYLATVRPSLPEVDFSSETIAAIFLGDSPACEARIVGITQEGGSIYINMQKDCPADLPSARPYFIIRMQKTNDAIFRTLKYIYAMPAPPTVADRAVEIISRNYSVAKEKLTVTSSRYINFPALSINIWQGVVTDKTNGKEYTVYLDVAWAQVDITEVEEKEAERMRFGNIDSYSFDSLYNAAPDDMFDVAIIPKHSPDNISAFLASKGYSFSQYDTMRLPKRIIRELIINYVDEIYSTKLSEAKQ